MNALYNASQHHHQCWQSICCARVNGLLLVVTSGIPVMPRVNRFEAHINVYYCMFL